MSSALQVNILIEQIFDLAVSTTHWLNLKYLLMYMHVLDWDDKFFTRWKKLCAELNDCKLLLLWFCFYITIMLNSSIENMLHTLHATHIRHDLYADFFLRLEKSLREFFSQQIHSSRWIKSFAAQISTVYFLSMSNRRFVNDTHAYHMRYCFFKQYRWCFQLEINSIIKTFKSQNSVKKWDS